jgi:hypothetical protein
MLVCDEHPEPWGRRQREVLAARLDIPVFAVEADALVPAHAAANHAQCGRANAATRNFAPDARIFAVLGRFGSAICTQRGAEVNVGARVHPENLDSIRIPGGIFPLKHGRVP